MRPPYKSLLPYSNYRVYNQARPFDQVSRIARRLGCGKGRDHTPPKPPKKIASILVAVGGNPERTDGTTVRAIRVQALLSERFSADLRGFRRFSTTMPKWQFVLLAPYWLIDQAAAVFKKKYDCVYCCNNRFGFLVYKTLQPLFRYRLIYEAHSVVSAELRSMRRSSISVKVNELLESFIASHSDRVVALSEHTASFFRKHGGKVNLIPVFVDTGLFRPDPAKRAEIRAKLGISKEDVLLGLIGPFDIIFNQYYRYFLKNNLPRFAPNIRIIVIGKCSEKMESPRIIYTGYVDDYAAYLAALDCVLVPADFPTGGPRNKIVEPMSTGLAVFTTPQGSANLDYARNGENLFIYAEKDLVSQINSFAAGPAVFNTGKNARDTIERYYSYSACREKLLAIFEL
jgi:glycosyltransferase involved in cell wall biosynthesis